MGTVTVPGESSKRRWKTADDSPKGDGQAIKGVTGMRKKRKTKKPFRARPLAVLPLLVVVGAAAGLLFSPVFRVSAVWCEGNQRIGQETILEAAQVKIGGNLFLQRLPKIKRRVQNIPMIEDVRIHRVFPDKIRITVTERTPAAYIHNDQKLIVLDLTGRVIETVEDERTAQAVARYTPKKVEAPKDASKNGDEETPGGDGKKQEGGDDAEPTATPKPTDTPEPTQTADTEDKAENGSDAAADGNTAAELPYSVPIVEGLTLEKPEVGKNADSKEREKLSRVMETFRYLNQNELLSRATFLDVTNINDVTLMIENRLQVQLGSLDNMEYRAAFLAKVVKERIGASEEAILDYRGEDIYARPPEDGKARTVAPTKTPQPSGTPKPSGTLDSGSTQTPHSSSRPSASAAAEAEE